MGQISVLADVAHTHALTHARTPHARTHTHYPVLIKTVCTLHCCVISPYTSPFSMMTIMTNSIPF